MTQPLEDPKPQVSPTEAATAAAAKLIAEQDAAKRDAFRDSLDIKDPGRKPNPVYSQSPAADPGNAPASPPELSSELLSRAKAAGYTDEDLKDFTPSLLERALSKTPTPREEPQERFDPEYQRYLEWRYQQDARAEQEAQRQQQFSGIPLPEAADGQPWDPALNQAWQQQQQFNQAMYQQLQAANQNNRQLQEQLKSRQDLEDQRTLESLIAKDDTYKDVLSTREAKGEVGSMMDAIVQNHERLGKAPPPPERLYEMARNAIHGVRAEKKAAQDVETKLRNSAGQFISKPTATIRGGDDLPYGTERAVRAVARKLQERNGYQNN